MTSVPVAIRARKVLLEREPSAPRRVMKKESWWEHPQYSHHQLLTVTDSPPYNQVWTSPGHTVSEPDCQHKAEKVQGDPAYGLSGKGGHPRTRLRSRLMNWKGRESYRVHLAPNARTPYLADRPL